MLKEKAECVKVVVRARPLSKGEITEGKNSVVTVDPSKGGIYIANPLNPKEVKSFFFDHSYDDTLSQETIFNETAKPIIDSVMQGYNGTIFAYGQTGTGKTFTMEGDLHSNQHKGIIPRTIEQIFNSIKESPNQQFLVQVSFVEIYNEEVRDLLNKNVKTKLDVRERDGGFYVQDCKIIKVENAKETLDYMFTGRDNRAKGATKMNKDSSRSHSIFTIIVENSSVEGGETKYKMGKLNLVDLAGSERQSKTEATGERLKEATKINLSLTVLGNVICALVNPKQSHIPYRESKLTMLLCDSLGGNTKTVMIANVGPADYNYEETLNTLWYANRAKNIKNKPKINEDPKDAMLRQYQEEIEKLRLQLQGFGGALPGAIGSKQVEEKVVFVEDDSRLKAIEENMEKEKEDYKVNAEKEIQKIKLQKNLAEEEKQRLIDSINKKSEDQRRIKDEQKKILKKYREMEKKLLTGKDVDKKVKEQEAKLAESRKILEEKRREEQRLQYELEIKKKNNIEIKQKYENNQAMLDDLNEKISLLRTKIEDSKRENKETQDGYNQEISNLMDAIKGMEIEMKKKDFVINFLTADYFELCHA